MSEINSWPRSDLFASHSAHDSGLGPLCQFEQPVERAARPHQKLSFQLGPVGRGKSRCIYFFLTRSLLIKW